MTDDDRSYRPHHRRLPSNRLGTVKTGDREEEQGKEEVVIPEMKAVEDVSIAAPDRQEHDEEADAGQSVDSDTEIEGFPIPKPREANPDDYEQ